MFSLKVVCRKTILWLNVYLVYIINLNSGPESRDKMVVYEFHILIE